MLKKRLNTCSKWSHSKANAARRSPNKVEIAVDIMSSESDGGRSPMMGAMTVDEMDFTAF